MNKSSVHHALTTLTQKRYISVQPEGNQGSIIDLSPLNERFKNDEKSKAESDFSAPKKEEEKIREERQISNENDEKNDEKKGLGNFTFGRRKPKIMQILD